MFVKLTPRTSPSMGNGQSPSTQESPRATFSRMVSQHHSSHDDEAQARAAYTDAEASGSGE